MNDPISSAVFLTIKCTPFIRICTPSRYQKTLCSATFIQITEAVRPNRRFQVGTELNSNDSKGNGIDPISARMLLEWENCGFSHSLSSGYLATVGSTSLLFLTITMWTASGLRPLCSLALKVYLIPVTPSKAPLFSNASRTLSRSGPTFFRACANHMTAS